MTTTSSMPWACRRVQRVVGDIGLAEQLRIGRPGCAPHPARRCRCRPRPPGRRPGPVPCAAKCGMRVVPADEVDGGHAAGQVLTGDAKWPVGLRADGVDHGVVVLGEFGWLHMLADGDVAEEPEPRVRRDLLELPADRLDLGMVRRHAGPHQAPRASAASPACPPGHTAEPASGSVGGFQQGRGGEVSRGTCSDYRHMVRAHLGHDEVLSVRARTRARGCRDVADGIAPRSRTVAGAWAVPAGLTGARCSRVITEPMVNAARAAACVRPNPPVT